MKRRLLALILCALLLVMLCELHICSGAHCAVCAQLNQFRRLARWALCAALTGALKLIAAGGLRVGPLSFHVRARTPVSCHDQMLD